MSETVAHGRRRVLESDSEDEETTEPKKDVETKETKFKHDSLTVESPLGNESRAARTAAAKFFDGQSLLVDAYVRENGLVRCHVDSFNYFVNHELKELVEQVNCKVLCDEDKNWYLRYNRVRVEPPAEKLESEVRSRKLTPNACRLRDMTYAGRILVDVEHVCAGRVVKVSNLCIGRMPIMVGSELCLLSGASEEQIADMKECPNDPGGYFIVRGVERVLLIHEQLSANRVLIAADRNGMLNAECLSSTIARKSKFWIVQKRERYYLRHNRLNDDVPLMIIFKALGIELDQEITTLISVDPNHIACLIPSFEECRRLQVATRLDALRWLRNRFVRGWADSGGKVLQGAAGNDDESDAAEEDDDETYGGHGLNDCDEVIAEWLNEIVAMHVPPDGHYGYAVHKRKAIYLAYMLRRLIRCERKESEPEDPDFYGNKRMELAGSMLSLLFDDLFKRFNDNLRQIAAKNMTKTNRAEPFDVTRHMYSESITNGLNHCLTSGNWVIKRFRLSRSGVTQVLSRLSFISAVGMMTRVNPTAEKSRKVSGPRALQPSQWGMFCPCDTPEGESCGLVKNLALLTRVTVESPKEPLIQLAYSIGVVDVNTLAGTELHLPTHYIVFLNGGILGVTTEPRQLVEKFRSMRRCGVLDMFVSVSTNDTERYLMIEASSGRLCRPYLIVNTSTGKPVAQQWHFDKLREGALKFDDFLRDGLIEYLDVNEENNANIAVYPSEVVRGETTHLEIEPFAVMGVCSALVPYAHHNQSPRNTYQCAMGKQAMGITGLNIDSRIDSLMYQLVYTQRPLVQTRPLEIVKYTEMPAGHNACVAVMSASGYDIEDAIVINKASLDRGFGRCIVYKNSKTVVKPRIIHHGRGAAEMDRGGEELRGPSLDFVHRQPIPNHRHLEEDGIARVGARVRNRQVLVNKFTPSQDEDTDGRRMMIMRENSTWYHGLEEGSVDRVALALGEDENVVVKLRLRHVRRPELGDKFSSRHGQKGVIGHVIPQEDMPFSASGIVPDLIMNPHGFPSRMTVGKLMELLAGKSACMDGRIKDSTVFAGDDIEAIADILMQCGHAYLGKETLTSGITGNTLQSYIFFGPIYYQKLKHMVLDKMHARARGPRANLTRQPTEGRARDGGLRVGEMERDCLIAHGGAMLIRERLLVSSDAYHVEVCACGLIAGSPGWCQRCRTSRNMSTIEMPYSCKLLFQELQSMGVMPVIDLTKQPDKRKL